jgi:transposase
MASTEVFMSNKQHTAEFMAEAVKQVIERGFTVVDVAARIGLPKHTLYGWVQSAKKAARASAPLWQSPSCRCLQSQYAFFLRP